MTDEVIVDLKSGEAVIILAGEVVRVEPTVSTLICFTVSTPLDKN